MKPKAKTAEQVLQEFEDAGKIVHLNEDEYESMKENLNRELETQKEQHNFWDQESYNLALTLRFG